MRFNKFALAGLAVCGSVLLAGCGGGGSDDASPVAQSDLTVDIKPTTGAATVASVLGQNFEFANGISALGTTASTSLKLAGDAKKPSFVISSGADSASGAMTYGSCIFTVGQSTFVAGHPLALGKVTTVNLCQLRVALKGRVADGRQFDADVRFALGNALSNAAFISAAINANGMVTLNGLPIGSVPVVSATGATGSGS